MPDITNAVEAAVLPWAGGRRSRTATRRPWADSRSATAAPMIPAPMIATSTGPSGRGSDGTNGMSPARQLVRPPAGRVVQSVPSVHA